MRILILCLLLGACSASGPVYTGKEKGNLVVYRPDSTLFALRDYVITIGDKTCKLSNAGFYITDIKSNSQIKITMWDMSGTSRLLVSPDSFIKITLNDDRLVSAGAASLFGAVGSLVNAGATKAVTNDGPFVLTKIKKQDAVKELQGLKQDCM